MNPHEDPTKIAPPVELLWPEGAPGARGEEEADRPTLTMFLPPKAATTGAAVVVCPGGGYGALAVGHEGRDVGAWLNGLGVAAFMMKYRIAPHYGHPAPLQDVKRAIRTVRARAKAWGVDPKRVGVWGFSAGGHLASTAATQFDGGHRAGDDPVEWESSRPDLCILGYPVILFEGPHMHQGSRDNLLGKAPSEALVREMSSERRVTPQTPPTFLFHTNEDRGVPPENSVEFYLALRRAGVPAEMHIFERGMHGVGLAPGDPALSLWPRLLANWMGLHGFLKKP
ncbi:MAG: alpha/beta hydrolase [Armatimonadetes bacterium]|nr:alpha/beta hydrolase [Armatimonadota bacterium]